MRDAYSRRGVFDDGSGSDDDDVERCLRAVAELEDRVRELEALLVHAGPRGAIVWDVLEGGVDRQREALSDKDLDGQPWLAEILSGTDPNRWDSDGDGWWDGASAAPVGAVPLPPDGTAVCSGVATWAEASKAAA